MIGKAQSLRAPRRLHRYLSALFVFAVAISLLMTSGALRLAIVRADNTAQPLPFSQNWSNTGLITADDNWANVPGIIGYRGDDASAGTGVDPQTVTQDLSGVVDVTANKSDPNGMDVNSGGITEFDGLADPVVAMQGSGTGDFPNLVIALNTTGQSDINVAYNLRDIDVTDNAVQAVALQFRVGTTGAYTNVPAGFVADATTGPNLATLVTPVSATLPAAANNQPVVQVRIITSNAVGVDEWVGVDEINITATGGGGGVSLFVNDVSQSEGSGGGQTAFTFTVSLSTTMHGGVTFDIATADGTAQDDNPVSEDNDYVANSATGVTIPNGQQSAQFTVQVNADSVAEPNETFFVNVTNVTGATVIDGQGQGTIVNDEVAVVPIFQIQGSDTASPFIGQSVTTTGIVTAKRSLGSSNNGFFIQDPNSDSNPNTSDAILVFTGSTVPTVSVGDSVQVTGTVAEFEAAATDEPDGVAPPDPKTITELTNPTVSILSTGNTLPAALNATALGILNPMATSRGAQLERYEHMRISIPTLVVSQPTNSFGEFWGVEPPRPRPFREPGIEAGDPVPAADQGPHTGSPPPNVPRWDGNFERIMIDSGAALTTGSTRRAQVQVTTGTTVTGIVGPLDYAFDQYRIILEASVTPGIAGGVTAATPAPVRTAQEFTIAHTNLENFTSSDATKLNKASLAIRNVMRTPDVVGLIEVDTTASATALANKINMDFGDTSVVNYVAYFNNTAASQDIGYLVNAARVTVVGMPVVHNPSASFTYCGITDALHDRPPFILTATVPLPGGGTLPFTVILNHTKSLIAVDSPRSFGTCGTGTEGARNREKRRLQAEDIADLVQMRDNAGENIVVLGDLNAFQFNDGLTDMVNTISGVPPPADQVVEPSTDRWTFQLTNLIDRLSPAERYSFVFEGSAQSLDHILVNSRLLARTSRFVYARMNADFSESLATDSMRPERVADHDPPVAYFTLGGLSQEARADFDGDGRTDFSIVRPTGAFGPPPLRTSPSGDQRGLDWYIINSQSNSVTVRNWGIHPTDIIVPGDYDGDGETDIAVARINNIEATWYIIESMTGAARVEGCGEAGDIPVPADYDGDGKTDVAVWRPSTGSWIIKQSSQGGQLRPMVSWGNESLGDRPVPGDYDGDGEWDIAVWRESEGNWYVINSLTGTGSVQGWGQGGDRPVQADYDADGITDLAVFRPSEGNWYVRNSATNTVTIRNWGLSTDILVPGDYDADGRTDFAVFRPDDGNWYVLNSSTNTVTIRAWGLLGDNPVPSAYIPEQF